MRGAPEVSGHPLTEVLFLNNMNPPHPRPMRFRTDVLTLFILALLPFLLVKDERIPGMTDVISIENLRQHVQALVFDRSPSDKPLELERASEYICNEFSKVGLRVWKEPLEWEGNQFHNIVAEKRGTLLPDQIVIVGAHYDTVPGSPGADDNASAVAVLLEMAANIQRVTTRSTVRLIAFTLEEYGYVGSTYYARKVKREGEKIVGMISLEMVGFTARQQKYPVTINPKYYPNVGDFIGIVGNQRSEALLGKVRQCLKTYVPQLPAEFITVPGNGEGLEEVRLSDHSPFWDEGYPALLVTDTAFLRNPNYHLPSDTIETLDFEFMKKVAVGVFYSVVELAK